MRKKHDASQSGVHLNVRQSFKPKIRTFVSNALNNVDHDRIWSLQWAHAKGDACGLLSAAGMGAMAAVHMQTMMAMANSMKCHQRKVLEAAVTTVGARVWDLSAGGDRGWWCRGEH